MSIDNFNLKCPILLGRLERESIKPEAEDVKKINLALRYLGLTENTCSGSLPGNGFYDDIEKFQRKYSCPVGEPLTNSSRTISCMKEELRKEEEKYRGITTRSTLDERTVEERKVIIMVLGMILAAKASGLRYGARALEHFLYKKGDIRYSKDEIRSFRIVKAAEEHIFKHFREKTMKGQTGIQKWNDALRNLKDGQTVTVEDYWDKDIQLFSWDAVRMLCEPDFMLALGDVKVRGFFKAAVSKQGKTISYRVQFTFKINDLFDWETMDERKKSLPGYKFPLYLEQKGIGKPFYQMAEWTTDAKTDSFKVS